MNGTYACVLAYDTQPPLPEVHVLGFVAWQADEFVTVVEIVRKEALLAAHPELADVLSWVDDGVHDEAGGWTLDILNFEPTRTPSTSSMTSASAAPVRWGAGENVGERLFAWWARPRGHCLGPLHHVHVDGLDFKAIVEELRCALSASEPIGPRPRDCAFGQELGWELRHQVARYRPPPLPHVRNGACLPRIARAGRSFS
ncbi:MAG: hypothetical protein QOH12_3037 [Solirubrobacteraceae bacterium]|jgi:hypothetical protein|nr:hypothetical protein [Solirubrobacteraceae bacterium]